MPGAARPEMKRSRNRGTYLLLLALTVVTGLFSRSDFLPALIRPYLGDVLYTLMCFFLLGFLFPRLSSVRVAFISVLFCYLIEFSQLYQADWINQIRRYRLGGLVLGYGFLWSDLLSYMVGGIAGAVFERLMRGKVFWVH